MISFEKNGIKFNFRTAGVAICNNKVLLHRYVKDEFWTFPGGRVEIGEEAESALKREFIEELNIIVENPKLKWIFENYFEYEKTKYHEVCFYYKVKINSFSDTISAFDNGRKLEFKWFNFTELNSSNIKPNEFKKVLFDSDINIKHIVTRT